MRHGRSKFEWEVKFRFLLNGVSQSAEFVAKIGHYMGRFMRKSMFWFLTRSDTNQAVQLQKMARGLKFRI